MKYFLGNKTRHVRYWFALIYSDMPSVCCCFIGCMANMTQAFHNIFYNLNCIRFGVHTGQKTHNMNSVYQIIGFHRESKGGLTFQLLNALIDAQLIASQAAALCQLAIFSLKYIYIFLIMLNKYLFSWKTLMFWSDRCLVWSNSWLFTSHQLKKKSSATGPLLVNLCITAVSEPHSEQTLQQNIFKYIWIFDSGTLPKM